MPFSAIPTSCRSTERQSRPPRERSTMTRNPRRPRSGPPCGRVHRRSFLADVGLGFTGMALGALLHRDGIARAAEPRADSPPDGRPDFPPKAQSVIWIFLSGGVSHIETWDPKPALTRFAGKTYD